MHRRLPDGLFSSERCLLGANASSFLLKALPGCRNGQAGIFYCMIKYTLVFLDLTRCIARAACRDEAVTPNPSLKSAFGTVFQRRKKDYFMNTSVALPIYQALSGAFVAEGVDTHFTLMGDGNMHFATALKNSPGMKTIHARHEHCACAMAMGYTSATGKVGVASVTCGPGFTQVMTALTSAARAQMPLVVFAGEVPLKAKYSHQAIEQQPLAAACGAHYIAAHYPERMYDYVREAFYRAQYERKPVVLGVPYDLQKLPCPDLGEYEPSSTLLPTLERIPPSPRQIEQVVARLAGAKHPIILAGRGVVSSDARKEVEALAEKSGALLATTLPGRGMFDHNPFSIGVCGGFARAIAREMIAKSDLILAFGASFAHHAIDGGRLIPQTAEVIQIDIEPLGLKDGARVADMHVKGDAKLTAAELLLRLGEHGPTKAVIRNPELAKRIRDEPAENSRFEVEPGTLDPRAVFEEIEAVLPKDYDVVSGSGHQSYFHTVMRGGDPTRYHVIRDFGAIGNGISFAIGVAVARENGRVVLFEGDGSLLMHIQELETLKRQGIKLLIVCSNDGAYGSEIHKLRGEGVDDSGAIFGRADLAAIATGFGLRGANVADLGRFKTLMAGYEANDTAEIWNVAVSDQVVSPRMKREFGTGSKAASS